VEDVLIGLPAQPLREPPALAGDEPFELEVVELFGSGRRASLAAWGARIAVISSASSIGT